METMNVLEEYKPIRFGCLVNGTLRSSCVRERVSIKSLPAFLIQSDLDRFAQNDITSTEPCSITEAANITSTQDWVSPNSFG